MKSIAFDCFGLTRPVYTGKEMYVYGLLASLLKWHSGFRITAVYPSITSESPRWVLRGLNTAPTMRLSSYTAWSQSVLPIAVRSLAPDVVVYTESMLPRLNLSRKTKTVVIIYDVMYLHVRDEFDRKTRQILHALMPNTVRKADAIVTISETSKNDLILHYGVDPRKITVVYPCVSEEMRSQSSANQILTKQRYEIKGRMIAYAGNHLLYKNIGNLLIAFRDLVGEGAIGQATLVLIGKRERKTLELEDQAKHLGVWDRLKITGYVNRQEYENLLCASDVLVLPSLYEGFGIPLIEAMACSVPVAASNVGAMAEVVGGSGILFDPREPKAIAHSIKRILLDSRLSDELRIKGSERVKQFSWNRSADVMSNVLNCLV